MPTIAAARETEADPTLMHDEFPNYSACGLPFYRSGETPDWHPLAHRTLHHLEHAGLDLLLEHIATANYPRRREVSAVRRNGLRLEIAYDRPWDAVQIAAQAWQGAANRMAAAA